MTQPISIMTAIGIIDSGWSNFFGGLIEEITRNARGRCNSSVANSVDVTLSQAGLVPATAHSLTAC